MVPQPVRSSNDNAFWLMHDPLRYKTTLMAFQFASRKQFFFLSLISLALGGGLALGLQPTTAQLGIWVLDSLGCSRNLACSSILNLCLFPLLCLVFHLSLPLKLFHRNYFIPQKRLFLMSLLPLLISFIFGYSKHGLHWEGALWAWLAVPIGEEFLFRGWVTGLLQRLFGNTFSSFLPFLPISIWGQALAFSIWHLQNIGQISPPLIGLQLFYTFFVGLWLGLIRWQTGRLLLPVLLHCLLNILSDWKLWFMV
jgi:membrane protease YdiL (CAAX protease family)